MHVAVRRFLIKGLEVTVHPELRDLPVAATQVKSLQQYGLDRTL